MKKRRSNPRSHPRAHRRGLGGTPSEHRAQAFELMPAIATVAAKVIEHTVNRNCDEAVFQFGTLTAQIAAAAQHAGSSDDEHQLREIQQTYLPMMQIVRTQLINQCVRPKRKPRKKSK